MLSAASMQSAEWSRPADIRYHVPGWRTDHDGEMESGRWKHGARGHRRWGGRATGNLEVPGLGKWSRAKSGVHSAKSVCWRIRAESGGKLGEVRNR